MCIITKIEVQKKRKNRYSIFIDEKFAFGVDEEVLLSYELKKGKTLDQEFIDNVLLAEEQVKANNYAMKLLSLRARSKGEIEQKMKDKGYEEPLVEGTIAYLNKYGYLNDYEFAKSFTKDRINFKKAGKALVRQELYFKGVDKDTINIVIEEVFKEEQEYETCLELAKKKISTTYRNEPKEKAYTKLSSFLVRKGYSYSLVSTIVKEVL